jgi:heat-inducible transcriptional repressor
MGLTTLCLLVLATPLAWWLSQTTSRWRSAVAALATLPLVLPPTVLGFYLLVLLGPQGWIPPQRPKAGLRRRQRGSAQQPRGRPQVVVRVTEEQATRGALVRQGLSSHAQARSGASSGAVAMGLGGLLRQPEFERSDSLRPLLQLVEEAPQELLESEQAQHPERLGVWIGSEHPNPALHHCAVVQAPYRTGSGAQGQVALVGPMRMAYSTARAAVQAVAGRLVPGRG